MRVSTSRSQSVSQSVGALICKHGATHTTSDGVNLNAVNSAHGRENRTATLISKIRVVVEKK